MESKYLPCPQCGTPAGVRIVYGDAPPAVQEAAARGEIALGGVTRGDASDPDSQCTRCGYKWRRGDHAGTHASERRR